MTAATNMTASTEGTTTESPPGTTEAPPETSSTGTGEPCVPAEETCDRIDNDCDGGVDEGSPSNPACEDCVFIQSDDGEAYFALCTGPLSWPDARIACERFGPEADLAMLDNDNDQTALLAVTTVDSWIGISDEAEEGRWVWIDGSTSIVNGNKLAYDGWDAAQPEGGSVENCAEMDPGKDGWADSECDAAQEYICRHPA